ncbi:hypothetical protein L226DRAFT_212357 [Lentinus tigrinus ALCF2SS1-7]|uniref:uncharacterized protein n=1 Tax=Lentinus tigrinus ALCF2SS1-7 TaxID=1328758 RepID=UPI0011662D96|nr:hypothetical protein L226DRAFT_212357 [Lentinus tigrinus ALCF2SS1-7]
MNTDMQFGQHGKYRREFYQAVCKKADELNSYPFRVPIGKGDSPVYTVKVQRDSPGFRLCTIPPNIQRSGTTSSHSLA